MDVVMYVVYSAELRTEATASAFGAHPCSRFAEQVQIQRTKPASLENARPMGDLGRLTW